MTGKKKEMDIALFRPSSISGRILLKGETNGLSGISIISRGPSTTTATSNMKGSYRLSNLKPGPYGFTINQTGFKPYTHSGTVWVKEGEEIRGIDHFVQAEEEKIKIAIYQEVYPLKKNIDFTVRAFRSEDFSLELYRIPLQWYLKNPDDVMDLLDRRTSTEKFKRVYQTRHAFKRYRPYRWFNQKVEIENNFIPGIYLVRATTANAEDRNFIFVSNIGVILKRGRSSVLAYAVNFETNQPEEGVKIFFLKDKHGEKYRRAGKKTLFQTILGLFRNERLLFKGETNDQGIFELEKGIPNDNLLVLGVKSKQGIGVAKSHRSAMAVSKGARFYLYTDRPVYRPGHTVFYKGILREHDGNRLKIKQGHEVPVELRNPKGDLLATQKRTPNQIGTINGSFEIPKDATLGRYTLAAGGYHPRNLAYFFVKSYRKPDFKVEINTGKEAYVANEPIKFTVLAAYFFGSPLSDARVNYRIYQKMTTRPFYRFWWEGQYFRRQGYQSLVRSAAARTDSQGFVSVEFRPPPKSYDRTITIEAEVIAPSGRKVIGRKTVIYNQSLYQVQIENHPYIHKIDRTLAFRIVITDIYNNRVKTKFTVSLEQEVWNPIRRRYETPVMPLYSKEFETEESGAALVEIPARELNPGYTRFFVSAVDPGGNGTSASASIWLFKNAYGNYNYNYTGLEIILDKEQYHPGDKAKLIVNTPVEKGVALFTLEGQDILNYQVISLGSKTRVIEIPVEARFAPNIYLSVVQHDGNRLYHKKISLNVAVEGKEIVIEPGFDKKEYRPKETARLLFKANDEKGNPLQGDFSVGVVDEAIYYIKPDHTTPIFDFFYARQSPWISTTYSFPIKYLGGAVKDSGRDQIRKDFQDTALWLPNVRTDKNGIAKIDIAFPDNLTTWVTTIRGHTKENLFGEKKERALVTKPLVTSLKLPRFFIRGDQTEIRVINYNRTDTPMEALQSKMAISSPLSLTGPAIQSTQIPKQGTGRFTWNVKVGKEKTEAKVTVQTVAGEMHDAEQRTVPVLSSGIPQRFDFKGRTHNGHAGFQFLLSKDNAMEATTLHLELTPHPALSGLASLDYLNRFPYGCVEQTLNSFIPVVSYYSALKELGCTFDDWKQLEKRVERGLAKLAGFQRTDGGFGWWRNVKSDVYMTSLVILGVVRVKDIAPEKCRAILSRASGYLKRQIMKEGVLDIMAFGLYALSEAGYENRVLANELKSKSSQMDALSLSFATFVFANHRMIDTAKNAADLLLEKIKHGAEGSYFQESEPYGHRMSIETTAYALRALLRVYPDHREVDGILNWLTLQKSGRYWISTKTTGVVVLTLSDFIKTNKDRIRFEDQDVSIFLNDGKVADYKITRSDFIGGKLQPVILPAENCTPGANSLSIEGEHDLYYSFRVKTFWESDNITPKTYRCDMPMKKKVYAVTRVHDARGNPRILSRLPEQDEYLRVGSEIKIELHFAPDRNYDYFILEDPLPSGFEVVDFDKDTGSSWWKHYAHKERRDDRVVFFFNRLQKKRPVTVEYILRSELKGHFHLPPARLFGMYKPTIYSHSGSRKLNVGPLR